MFKKRIQGDEGGALKIVFALLGCIVIFVIILEKFTYPSKCEYFEGLITEKSKEYMMIQMDDAEENDALINIVGNEIKIKKECVLRQDIFERAKEGTCVRVAYNWISVAGEPEKQVYVYMIYDKGYVE